jgi:hypothetical protein
MTNTYTAAKKKLLDAESHLYIVQNITMQLKLEYETAKAVEAKAYGDFLEAKWRLGAERMVEEGEIVNDY